MFAVIKAISGLASMPARLRRMRQRFGALLDEMPRKLGIHVVEKTFAQGRPKLLDFLNGLGDFRHERFFEGRILGVIEESSKKQMPSQSYDGIAQSPLVNFVLRTIARGIVARRMRAHAIRERLDERRTMSLSRAGNGVTHRSVEGKYVVAIDACAWNAVGTSLDGKGGRSGLPFRWNADGPVIVLTNQDAWHFEDARKVERVVKVWFAGAAVTDKPHGDRSITSHLGSPRSADDIGYLRCHAARPGDLIDVATAHVRGHLTTLEHVSCVSELLRDVAK